MKKTARSWKFPAIALALSILPMLITGCPTEEFEAIAIDGIDLSSTADGTYEGAFDTTMVKATVAVTVKANRITAIEILRHDNGMGKKAEAIVDRVIEAQSTKVDTVSGATGSSLVILEAIEKAVAK